MERRRMCPNCRAFITINDRVCPYCEAQLGPRAVDLRPDAFASSFLPSANASAIILLAINLACFVASRVLPENVDPGVAFGPDVFGRHQWWRLISAGFLHGGWLHLIMNSWSLFILVTEVEQFFGTNRLIIAYTTSTISGFLFASFFSRGYTVGASCAAFGLMGMMFFIGVFGDRANPLVQLIRQHYGQWLIFSLVMTVFPQWFGMPANISVSGHIGGLIGGFVTGMIVRLPGHPKAPNEQLWRIVAYGSLILVFFCLYLDFANISHQLR